jgi:hypothetical protein
MLRSSQGAAGLSASESVSCTSTTCLPFPELIANTAIQRWQWGYSVHRHGTLGSIKFSVCTVLLAGTLVLTASWENVSTNAQASAAPPAVRLGRWRGRVDRFGRRGRRGTATVAATGKHDVAFNAEHCLTFQPIAPTGQCRLSRKLGGNSRLESRGGNLCEPQLWHPALCTCTLRFLFPFYGNLPHISMSLEISHLDRYSACSVPF